MNWRSQWRLALRLLWREARSGELSLMLAALVLAVTSATAIALFSARLDAAMMARSHDLLGADMRVRSTTKIDEAWQEKAERLGLATARTLSFPSVVMRGDEMTLVAIKAVDEGYPLRGVLRVQQSDHITQRQSQGPRMGEAWVEQRVLALLDAQLGDQVSVGRVSLTISGVIVEESDRGGNFYNLNPRLMMHWDDIPASGLTEAGSRLSWRLLLKGDGKQLEQFQENLELGAHQRIETLEDGNQAVANTLAKARRYLGLAAMLSVVLASVAVAISAQRYATRHFDISALMRTFGLSRKQVWRLYAMQLLQLGVLGTLLGLAAALWLQELLLWTLADLVPKPLPRAPWSAWLLGASVGLITLMGFALPYLMPLARVTPLRVLRRELQPVPLAGWLITLLAFVALTVLLAVFTRDMTLTLAVMLGGGLVLLVLLLWVLAGISAVRRLLANRALPLHWRFAWQHISRAPRQSAGQLLAFALTLMVMVIIGNLRTDLLADWQSSLPEDAPNVFVMNLQPYEGEDFINALQAQGLSAQKLYPVVPGRLTEISGQAVSELPVASDSAINRDLVLTTGEALPDSNRLVAGDWQALHTQTQQVSVEAKLAKRLGVGLGDALTFVVAGETRQVTISSLREVDWSTMTPNFFMMFSPDVLADLPHNYLTSFRWEGQQQAEFSALVRQFPAATFLDVQAVMNQIQTLLAQVSVAVELILLFVLMAALLVMLSSLVAAMAERLREGAILRTLGGSRALIRRSQRSEFVLLGAMSACLALIGAEAICFGLYWGVLKIPYSGLGWAWLWLPPLAILLMWVPPMLLLRRTQQVAPLQVLRGLND